MASVDHKPLTFAIAKAAVPRLARQQRQYTTDIQHAAGKDNLADCLSRAQVGSKHLVDMA